MSRLPMLFWATPVVYETAQLPGRVQALILLTPLSPYVTAYHDLFYYRRWPTAETWTLAVLYAVVIAAVWALGDDADGAPADGTDLMGPQAASLSFVASAIVSFAACAVVRQVAIVRGAVVAASARPLAPDAHSDFRRRCDPAWRPRRRRRRRVDRTSGRPGAGREPWRCSSSGCTTISPRCRPLRRWSTRSRWRLSSC